MLLVMKNAVVGIQNYSNQVNQSVTQLATIPSEKIHPYSYFRRIYPTC
jgi:hypothetical protein